MVATDPPMDAGFFREAHFFPKIIVVPHAALPDSGFPGFGHKDK